MLADSDVEKRWECGWQGLVDPKTLRDVRKCGFGLWISLRGVPYRSFAQS